MTESPFLLFDKTVLSEPVPDAAVAAEAEARLRAEGGSEGSMGVSTSAVIRVVVLVLGAAVLAVVFVRVIQMLFGAPRVTAATIVIGCIMVVPLAIAQVRGVNGGMREMRRAWYRLARFARANGLEYTIRRAQVPDGAALFEAADAGVATDVVTRTRERAFETGNYAFETWAGRTRTPRNVAYVAFTLSEALPRMTLIATSSAGGSPCWSSDPRQRPIDVPDLIGHFRVHALPGEEEAVRRVLTPDLCARLVALAALVDVEVAGDRILFLSRRAAPMQEVAFWEWVEDLSRMLDAYLDPRSETAGAPMPLDASSRVQRRQRLFRLPGGGRPFLIGCLLPVLAGITLAIITAM